MAIQKLYRVQCDHCRNFLPRDAAPPSVKRLADPAATPLFTDYQDAVAASAERGWTKPGICPPCQQEVTTP